jgi:peroxiredoxin
MKRFCPLLSVLFTAPALFSQQAPDFTITTTDGNTHQLYAALAAGKTVVLDFFYTTCQGCYYYAPVLDSCYQRYGSGTGTVEFWGIDWNDDNATVTAFMQTYNVNFPNASGTQGNGNAVNALFNITQYPTYVVVCPDKRMHAGVNYPPSSAGFDPFVVDSCGASVAGVEPGVVQSPLLQVSPNPSSGQFTMLTGKPGQGACIEVCDLSGQTLHSLCTDLLPGRPLKLHIPLESGLYLLRVRYPQGTVYTARIAIVK